MLFPARSCHSTLFSLTSKQPPQRRNRSFSSKRTATADWADTLGQAGTDYKSTAESSVLITQQTFTPSWQSWDLAFLTQKWLDGTVPNQGVMLIADNETVVGYDRSLP